MTDTGTDTWIPSGLQLDVPNSARIYDYILGGYHNFEMDRLVAEKVIEIYPDARRSAQACRAFLRRVVTFLVEQGVDQFLDVGAGIPTVGNTHKVAQNANPAVRVVYVDIDPVAVAHSRAMLQDNPQATAIQGDVQQPQEILNHPEVKGLLDFGRPVAVLLLLILHAVPDDEEAYSAVRTFRAALAPGSYIAISHGTCDNAPPGVIQQMETLSAGTSTPSRYRPRSHVQAFFEGLELVKPGLVYIPLWRPEGPDDIHFDEPERSLAFGGIGRKPWANAAQLLGD
jgi:hypothetical protein